MDLNDFYTPMAKERAIKVDKAARLVALMERGEYQNEGYTPRKSKDGGWIPSMKEAFVSVGFASTYVAIRDSCAKGSSKLGRWYQERLIHHRMQLSGGYAREIAKLTENGVDLTRLRGLAYQSLVETLTKEPEKIPFKDRARLYVDITRMEAAARAANTKENPSLTQTNVLAIIGSKFNDPHIAGELIGNLQERMESAAQEVDDIIDVTEVMDGVEE